MSQYIYRHGLNLIFWQKPKLINQLVEYFASAKNAWEASYHNLYKSGLLKNEDIEKFFQTKEKIDLPKSFKEHSEGLVKCMIPGDKQFPFLLNAIADPPPILYYMGKVSAGSFFIALVGSRKHTVYGKETAFKLAATLAQNNVAVVSGLARGIDTWSHKGCLEGGGKTVAVLGCGLDVCYPPENSRLMETIIEKGMVVSEFPLGTQPVPLNFPRRNRVIAGMSRGTAVIEAAERSGALITAHLSLDYNREVFAVPGSIGSPYSRGCHKLIKEGAKLVESADDILEEFTEFQNLSYHQQSINNNNNNGLSLNSEESTFLEIIPFDPYHLDQIIEVSGKKADIILPLLLDLELKGFIKQLPGKYFLRI